MLEMDHAYFESCFELCVEAQYIFNHISCDDDELETVSIIAKYEEANQIVSSLALLGFDLSDISLCQPEFNGYHDEYLIELTKYGVSCEPMKIDGEYPFIDNFYTYICNNCNSKVLHNIDSCFVCEVDFDEPDDSLDLSDDLESGDDEYYGENCFCELDSDMKGFTISKQNKDKYSSISFHSNCKCSAMDIEHLLRLFSF